MQCSPIPKKFKQPLQKQTNKQKTPKNQKTSVLRCISFSLYDIAFGLDNSSAFNNDWIPQKP